MLNWCFEHPWMTFFLLWALIDCIEKSIKYLTGYHKKDEEEKETKVTINY